MERIVIGVGGMVGDPALAKALSIIPEDAPQRAAAIVKVQHKDGFGM